MLQHDLATFLQDFNAHFLNLLPRRPSLEQTFREQRPEYLTLPLTLQAYETYTAGFQFLVLNNAFTSHRGFQTIKSRPRWRAKQHEENMKLLHAFAQELKTKYGKDPKNFVSFSKMFSKAQIPYEKSRWRGVSIVSYGIWNPEGNCV